MFGFDILTYGLMVFSASCPAQREGWPVSLVPTLRPLRGSNVDDHVVKNKLLSLVGTVQLGRPLNDYPDDFG
jgi:hypothetical protein